MKLTDEAVIAGFMEKLPTGDEPFSALCGGWWRAPNGIQTFMYGLCYEPAPLTLDRLHLVEQRLTVADWRHYCAILWQYTDAPTANAIEDLILRHRRTLIHLSTEQKITALAAVLRSASARGPGAGSADG